MAKLAKGWLTFWAMGRGRRITSAALWKEAGGDMIAASHLGEIVKHRMGQGTVGQPARHPAALLACFRPDLTGGLPEPERAIDDGEPQRHVNPTPVQVERQIAPVLRALEGAIGEADQFLAAIPASRQSAAGNPAASLPSGAASASEKSRSPSDIGCGVSIRL